MTATRGRASSRAEADRPDLEVERRHVLGVMKLYGGNKTRAARALGFDRRTLHRKLARFARESTLAPASVPEAISA